MKKILFISNVSNRITNFAIPSIVAGQSLEYDFHMAANYSNFTDDASKYNVTIHHIDIKRNPFNIKNIKAYKQMLDLIKKEKFDVIHCNTPIGGVLGRICGAKAGVKTIIYTAHGFHFYKGAPLINRTLYKTAERYMAKKTDAIITMNEEDFETAKKFKLRDGKQNYFLVNGVGIDIDKFKNIKVERKEKRKELGLKPDDIMLIAMGDLIKRKNYQASIKSIAEAKNPKLHFFICGKGPLKEKLMRLADSLNVANQIHFLGFRTDIGQLLKCSDIFLFTTYQEGLPRSMMEAMSVGLPCVCSKIRGNVDLIDDGRGGYLFSPNDIDGFAKAINKLEQNEDLRHKMGQVNLENVKPYSIENVKKQMKEIYESILD